MDLSDVRVILHAGLTPELSESLDRALRVGRRQLDKQRVLTVGPMSLDEVLSEADDERAANSILKLISSTRDGKLPRTVVLLSDRLFGPSAIGAHEITGLRPDSSRRIQALAGRLGARRLDVVFHCLRQDLLVSQIQTAHVEAGGVIELGSQLAALDNLPLSYRALARGLVETPGVDSVVVRPGELLDSGPEALALDFLSAVGLETINLERVRRVDQGSPWSNRALTVAMAVNPALETEADRKLVHGFLQGLLPQEPNETTRAGRRSTMTSVVEMYGDDNELLFKEHMPDLDPLSYRHEAATDEMIESFAAKHGPDVLEARLAPEAVYVTGTYELDIRDLTLHVGLQKTGTTTVQKALTRLRPQIHSSGVAYVDRADIMRLPSLRAWSAYRRSGGAKFKEFVGELREAVAKRYQAVEERTGSQPRAVLISNEAIVGVHRRMPDFERPLRPRAESAIGELLDALEPAFVRVLLYVRRQDGLLESQYMHSIHGGAGFTFEEYCSNVLASPVLRYSSLADRIAHIDGVNELRVRPFEIIRAGPAAFVSDLVSPLALDTVDFDEIDDVSANPSYSERALRVALAVNPLLKRKREAVRMRKFLEMTIPASSNPPARLLNDTQREKILVEYRPDNERLFARYMPDLPLDSYSRPDGVRRLANWLKPEGAVRSRTRT